MSRETGDGDFLKDSALVVLVFVVTIAMAQCRTAERDALCAENFERHASTAADSLRFVRSGCSVPLAGGAP